mmetsp:Transcript_731/g.2081  ORF Transcript_731/g.2081 Transcript_731/m.2081 type:complete len:319 (+) Transcript_731:2531-3487(+)
MASRGGGPRRHGSRRKVGGPRVAVETYRDVVKPPLEDPRGHLDARGVYNGAVVQCHRTLGIPLGRGLPAGAICVPRAPKRGILRARVRPARERHVLAPVITPGTPHPVVSHPRIRTARQEKRSDTLPNVHNRSTVHSPAFGLARVEGAIGDLSTRALPGKVTGLGVAVVPQQVEKGYVPGKPPSGRRAQLAKASETFAVGAIGGTVETRGTVGCRHPGPAVGARLVVPRLAHRLEVLPIERLALGYGERLCRDYCLLLPSVPRRHFAWSHPRFLDNRGGVRTARRPQPIDVVGEPAVDSGMPNALRPANVLVDKPLSQ